MNIFSYIKTRIQILDVISEYTSLKKAGTYWKGHCPFHNERTASFTVSPSKEIFYCFGCHSGGDVITFIAKIEGCSQLESAKHLAERYHITIPNTLDYDTPKQPDAKEKYFQLCKIATEWYQQQLVKNPLVMQYLRQRGFNKEFIELFQIGYFSGGIQSVKSFIAYMNKYLFLNQDMIEASLLSEGKNSLYSPFEERIIFPIKDIMGRYCGFGGRIFKDNDLRPKYYNSHENSYFNKGSTLFGLDIAKKSIQKTNRVFLVEGYTDCIAMSQHGFLNTVATLGTACTSEHLKILSRHAENLYVVYDGDQAGQKAIIRLTELCWQFNIELKVVHLHNEQDPASLLCQGENIEKIIQNAKDIFIFLIDASGKDFSTQTLNQKLQSIKHIIKIINNIEDPLKKEILFQNASKTLSIPIESIKTHLDQKCSLRKPEKPQLPLQEITNEPQKLEKKIFFAIMNNIELLNRDNEEYLIEHLPNPFKTILQKLQKARVDFHSLNFNVFFNIVENKEKQQISKILLEFEEEIELKIFEQLLLQFQKKYWKHIVQKIKTKLDAAKKESNEKEVAKILNSFLDLKKKLVYKGLITKK